MVPVSLGAQWAQTPPPTAPDVALATCRQTRQRGTAQHSSPNGQTPQFSGALSPSAVLLGHSPALANLCPKMKSHLWLFSLFSTLWSSAAPEADGCEEGGGCREDFQPVNYSSPLLPQHPGHMFSEHLDLSKQQLSAVPSGKFRSFCRLKVLFLSDNNISSLDDGTFCPLENLLKLDLRRNTISSLGQGFSLGLGSLKELLLARNKLTHLSAGSFLQLGELQRLDLSANAIRSIDKMAFRGLTSLRQLHLEDNQLECLSAGIFPMLQRLEMLHLQENQIKVIDADVFTPLTSLAVLNLTNNNLTSICFRTFLSILSYSTHILLKGNQWHCNCDLQRVFHKLRDVRRLSLDDYSSLHCTKPQELWGHQLSEVESKLCVAETVTVLIITLTVVITVVASIVMAERNRKKRTGKHWSEDSDMSYDSQS
ncbi:leucine-rich repeats and immunoglobulin-like domains protein 1-like [Scleropages formosus]|nr:leucine-rich repeats and immunoglobulin-like domains protein 1-like [Scleropages formosus]